MRMRFTFQVSLMRVSSSRSKRGFLPKVLHLNLDNTCSTNKNHILLHYLCKLVEKGIFKTIHLGFMLVGHTHDHTDQVFSRYDEIR